MKKTIIIICGIILFFLTLIILANQSKFASMLMTRLSSETAKSGVLLQTTSPSFTFWGIHSQETLITTKLGPILLNLPFKNLKVTTSPISLLTSSNKQVNIVGELFGGEIKAAFQNVQPEKKSLELTSSIKDLDLTQVGLLAFLGLSSGQISITTTPLNLKQNILSGKASVEIKNLNKPDKNIIPAYLSRLPLDLEIPAISDLNGSAQIDIKANNIAVNDAWLKSSLLEVSNLSGKTSFQQANFRKVASLDYRGDFRLSPEGLEILGPYLRLLGANPIANKTTGFEFSQQLVGAPGLSIRFK